MVKYITLATCNCEQSGRAKEFVSHIQAHVYSCLEAHIVLLPDKILQVGRSPSFLLRAWEAIGYWSSFQDEMLVVICFLEASILHCVENLVGNCSCHFCFT